MNRLRAAVFLIAGGTGAVSCAPAQTPITSPQLNAKIQQLGCMGDMSSRSPGGHHVIHGSFSQRGSVDTAVFCDYGNTRKIVVFWNGSALM